MWSAPAGYNGAMETVDVAIIGGGITGLSIAWHLSEGDLPGGVLLLEAEAMLATGSTARSVGGFRQQTGDPVLTALSRRSLEVYADFEARLGRPLDLRRNGYLLLATSEAGWADLAARAERERGWGVAVDSLTPAEVARLVPGVRTDDVVGGTHCGQDGFLDPSGAAHGFAAAARRGGVRMDLERRVTGLLRDGERVSGVRTDAGDLTAGTVVVATGPRAAELLAPCGIDLPLSVCKRQVFVADPTDALPFGSPLVMTEEPPFYALAESAAVLLSRAEKEPVGGDGTGDLSVDWAALEDVVARALHRVPALADSGIRRGWAGLRTLTPDGRPCVGPCPGAPGLFVAAGFNGKGVMHAPALGALAADLLLGRPRPAEADALAPDRTFRRTGKL